MLQEEGEWWMYGVFPATLSENGSTPNECFLRYMEELKTVLYDFAAGAANYDVFESELQSFLSQTSPDEALWIAAQQKLSAGAVEPENEKFIQSLPEGAEARS